MRKTTLTTGWLALLLVLPAAQVAGEAALRLGFDFYGRTGLWGDWYDTDTCYSLGLDFHVPVSSAWKVGMGGQVNRTQVDFRWAEHENTYLGLYGSARWQNKSPVYLVLRLGWAVEADADVSGGPTYGFGIGFELGRRWSCELAYLGVEEHSTSRRGDHSQPGYRTLSLAFAFRFPQATPRSEV